jgi:hypothetical protein
LRKIQRHLLLIQVVHIKTTALKRVKFMGEKLVYFFAHSSAEHWMEVVIWLRAMDIYLAPKRTLPMGHRVSKIW